MKNILILVFMLISPGLAQAREKLPELKAVGYVDMERGDGAWYEIARITHWYEKGLAGVKAELMVLGNGKIKILNSWYEGSLAGKRETWVGRGKALDKNTNSKLRVTFFWPFYEEYWIIDIGKYYEYMVIGEPERKYLWIFSRTPTIDHETFRGILERLKSQGYDISKLEITVQ